VLRAIPVLLLVSGAVALAAPAGPVQFTDVTAKAGISFVHNSGRAGKKFLPETLGSGVAFFDADNDGWPDLLLVNSRDWKPRGRKTVHALYRNNHDGTFANVTAASGLDVEMYGMGVAVAAKRHRGVALRVEIDEQRLRAGGGYTGGQVDCGRRLADAALLVRDCVDEAHWLGD